MISESNWNYTHFTNQGLKSFISFEAIACENELQEMYVVNITDEFDNDIYQRRFEDLNDACRHISQKFTNIWELSSTGEKSGSGCSSCIAH